MYAENISSAPKVILSANDNNNTENAPKVFTKPYIGAKDPKNTPKVVSAHDTSDTYRDAIGPMATGDSRALDHYYQPIGDHK